MKESDAWNRAALLDSPMFRAVHAHIAALPSDHFPDCSDLNRLAHRQNLLNANGKPLRFMAPASGVGISAVEYEGRAYRHGEVSTRPDSWHDLFNALAWLAFPRTKALINKLHIVEIARQSSAARSTARDVLTLFDEGGMIVPCSDPALAQLLTGFHWKALFWEQRARVAERMDFYIVGHAVHEKAVTPYKGITAKAIIVPVEQSFFAATDETRVAQLDTAAASMLSDSPLLQSTSNLQPVPILGIPGWTGANECADYYDDVHHFRPGRMRLRK